MRRISALIAGTLLLVVILRVGAVPAQQSWTGEISDSACTKEHSAGEGLEVPPAPECVKICLRNGSKYVFIAGGESIYKISNQDHPDLAKSAGKPIRMFGELKGDIITVTKIEDARY